MSDFWFLIWLFKWQTLHSRWPMLRKNLPFTNSSCNKTRNKPSIWIRSCIFVKITPRRTKNGLKSWTFTAKISSKWSQVKKMKSKRISIKLNSSKNYKTGIIMSIVKTKKSMKNTFEKWKEPSIKKWTLTSSSPKVIWAFSRLQWTWRERRLR